MPVVFGPLSQADCIRSSTPRSSPPLRNFGRTTSRRAKAPLCAESKAVGLAHQPPCTRDFFLRSVELEATGSGWVGEGGGGWKWAPGAVDMNSGDGPLAANLSGQTPLDLFGQMFYSRIGVWGRDQALVFGILCCRSRRGGARRPGGVRLEGRGIFLCDGGEFKTLDGFNRSDSLC